ncbi:hypothetical protein D3C85_1025580 [compost metagenome]
MPGQHYQQVVLTAGQFHQLLAPGHGAFGQVDAQIAHNDTVVDGLRLAKAAAAQQRANAGQQNPGFAGFGDVVVGAHLQAQHLVVAVVAGGEHEDR